jgi:hypothetical protein
MYSIISAHKRVKQLAWSCRQPATGMVAYIGDPVIAHVGTHFASGVAAVAHILRALPAARVQFFQDSRRLGPRVTYPLGTLNISAKANPH